MTNATVRRETQVGDVAQVERAIVSPANIRDGTRYVGLEDIESDGGIVARTVEAGHLRSAKFAFTDRHVLYGKLRPYLRKVARPSFAGVCSTDILPILPGPDLDRDFLFHVLRQPRLVSLATARSDGVNLPRVSPKALLGFPVSVPPLAEQRRIAAMLDKADAVRRKRRESLRLLDEFLRSAFLEMFGDPVRNEKGWEVVRLDRVADIVSGVTKGRKLRGQEATRPVPYLRVANVQDGYLDLGEIKAIEATVQEIVLYCLEPGDILLTEGGDPDKLGRGAVWRAEVKECIHQNHVFRVRLTDGTLMPEYVNALLGSGYGKRYFLKAAKQTTGIASINRTQLGGFPVIRAPLQLQSRHERIVSQTSTLEIRLEAAELVTNNLFDSLAQRAFGRA